MQILREKEREILQIMIDSWVKDDLPLPGDISYQDVVHLLAKLGLSAVKIEETLHNLESSYARNQKSNLA